MLVSKKLVLLGLHGNHGVGKDTIAEQLLRFGFNTDLSFGSRVHLGVADAFGVGESILEDRKTKEEPIDRFKTFNCNAGDFRQYLIRQDPDIYAPQSVRNTLIRYAAFAKEKNPEVFVDQVYEIARIQMLRASANIVVSDVKDQREFLSLQAIANEIDCIFKVVEITRAGYDNFTLDSGDRLPRGYLASTFENLNNDIQMVVDQIIAYINGLPENA